MGAGQEARDGAEGSAVTTSAGVDGCRGGWLMVTRQREGGAADIHLAASWEELPTLASLVCVDMPIGLAEQGARECDVLARRALGRERGASVFPAPNRPMLGFPSWRQANAWGRRRGRGLPRQSWGLVDKIRELDRALTPARQRRVREAHPELVFKLLNGDRPPPPKRTPEGQARRRRILEGLGFTELAAWLSRWPRRLVKIDDVLDACACCVAAERIRAGVAVRLPERPPRDARGLRMEIWF